VTTHRTTTQHAQRLSVSHTHTHTHARTHARTHTVSLTHPHLEQALPLSLSISLSLSLAPLAPYPPLSHLQQRRQLSRVFLRRGVVQQQLDRLIKIYVSYHIVIYYIMYDNTSAVEGMVQQELDRLITQHAIYIILYYIILYYIIVYKGSALLVHWHRCDQRPLTSYLYCFALYHTMLYYIVLYYVTLYYIILGVTRGRRCHDIMMM
jgi:hypothetical protein